MKSIKYSIITMAALAVGTIGSYAVSASSETVVEPAISISEEPITLEDAAALTQTAHSGGKTPRQFPLCPKCGRVGKSIVGHCRNRGRLFSCFFLR